MIKKNVISAIIVVSLIALAVGLFLLPGPTKSIEQPADDRTTDVKIMEVRPASLQEWIELPASVEPFLSTEVSAEVSGRIDWIGPKEGEVIREPNTPLLRIDQRTFRARVDEAQAAYDLASNNCGRMEQLHAQGIISNEQIDQCKTTVATSAAELEIAKIQLEKATVHAPSAGVLNKCYFDEGEYVNQGNRVADIVVIDPVKVLVKVPEKDIPYVRLGEKVRVTFKVAGEKQYEGTVSYISVVGEKATRTYDVEITVANPTHEILPSMITTVRILRQQIPDAITVPLFAVIPRGDFNAVFVEKDGKAEERMVGLGILDGTRVQITKGLEPNDRLIVEGHRELADGEPVRVSGSAEVPS